MASSSIRITHRGNVKEVEWKIPDFINRCELADQYGLCSDTFLFAGDTWYLNIWFKKKSLRAGLRRYVNTFKNDCSVQWSMGFKKENGEVESVGETWTSTFSDDKSFKHYVALKSWRYLEQNRFEFLPSGVLTIVCTFDVGDPAGGTIETAVFISGQNSSKGTANNVKVAKQTESQKYMEKLCDDLSEVMLGGDESDFTVKVKGEEFRLHRIILAARSPVFRSMLKYDMKEKTDGFVCIDDCEPGTFHAFVRFLYSARVDEVTTETVFELHTLADKYQVDDLKSACLDFIREALSLDTFCDAVTVALTYGLKDLLDQATNFFAQNTIAVIETVEWMNFIKKRPIESNEMHRKALLINLSKCTCEKSNKNETK